MAFITNLLRELIWAICATAFVILDWGYNILIDVTNLNILQSDVLWGVWSRVMLLIGIAILFRVIMIGAREFMDDEEGKGINWLNILTRIMLAAVLMGAFPVVAKEVGKFGQDMVAHATTFAGASANTSPSNIIVSGFINHAKQGNPTPMIEYNYKDIDINLKVGGFLGVGAEYAYFPKFSDLFLCLVFGLVVAVFLFIAAVNIVKNWFVLAALVLGSFMPISSIVDSKSDQVKTYAKMFGSCYLTNFFSVLVLMFTITLSCSQMIINQGIWVQITVMIGGLLLVMSGIPQLQRLIGGDTGAEQTLQQLFYATSMALGLGKGIAAVGGFAARTGTWAAAGSSYLTGRTIGGRSMKNLYGGGSTSLSSGGTNINNAAYGPTNTSGGDTTDAQGVASRPHFEANEKVKPDRGVQLSRPNSRISRASYALQNSANPTLRVVGAVGTAVASHVYSMSINRLQRRNRGRYYQW